jgi:hypothetical protein
MSFHVTVMYVCVIVCSVRCAGEGAAPLPAQVRQQRGGKVRPERQPRRARHTHRRGMYCRNCSAGIFRTIYGGLGTELSYRPASVCSLTDR